MEWVDFKEIKENVSLKMVIDHYGWKIRTVGPQILRGRCPLPTHASEKSRKSFTATLSKGPGGVWACQSDSCVGARDGRKGGNVLDLVAAVEQCSVPEAAEKLQAWFGAAPTAPASPLPRRQEPTAVNAAGQEPYI